MDQPQQFPLCKSSIKTKLSKALDKNQKKRNVPTRLAPNILPGRRSRMAHICKWWLIRAAATTWPSPATLQLHENDDDSGVSKTYPN